MHAPKYTYTAGLLAEEEDFGLLPEEAIIGWFSLFSWEFYKLTTAKVILGLMVTL